MTTQIRWPSPRSVALGLVFAGAGLALSACQSSSKGGSDVVMSPGQAQAAYYGCIRTDARGTIRGGTTNYDVATRFLNRCAGELADWEDALVASGTSPERAAEITDGVRDSLREQIMENLREI